MCCGSTTFEYGVIDCSSFLLYSSRAIHYHYNLTFHCIKATLTESSNYDGDVDLFVAVGAYFCSCRFCASAPVFRFYLRGLTELVNLRALCCLGLHWLNKTSRFSAYRWIWRIIYSKGAPFLKQYIKALFMFFNEHPYWAAQNTRICLYFVFFYYYKTEAFDVP